MPPPAHSFFAPHLHLRPHVPAWCPASGSRTRKGITESSSSLFSAFQDRTPTPESRKAAVAVRRASTRCDHHRSGQAPAFGQLCLYLVTPMDAGLAALRRTAGPSHERTHALQQITDNFGHAPRRAPRTRGNFAGTCSTRPRMPRNTQRVYRLHIGRVFPRGHPRPGTA
jgi:hypothetical protein